MRHRQAAFGHHLNQVTQTELEPKIPAHAQDDDFAVEVATLEQPRYRIHRAHRLHRVEGTVNQFTGDGVTVDFGHTKSGSQRTLRWREMDSNHRSLSRASRFILRKAITTISESPAFGKLTL
jgi:hypothetical protein